MLIFFFTSFSAGNVMTNFEGQQLMTAVSSCFLADIIFTFPLVLFSSRVTLHTMTYGPGHTASTKQHYLETILIFGSSLLVGLFVRDVALGMSFFG